MPYIKRKVSELPFVFNCCSCGYSTKVESAIINHFKRCKDIREEVMSDDIDDILSYELDDDHTIQDEITCTLNSINICREFIKTNELKAIEKDSMEEILLYIAAKLVKVLHPHKWIRLSSLNIYGIFFVNKDDDNERTKEFKKILFEEMVRDIFN